MKQKLSSFILFLSVLYGLPQLSAQSMYVRPVSGLQTVYALNTVRKLSFSANNLVITKTSGHTDSYSINGLRYLNFKDMISGVNELKEVNPAVLFPNPARDILNIKSEGNTASGVIIEIQSLDGKTLLRNEFSSTSNIHQLNISSLGKGLYLCRINNGISIETSKFIKH